MISESEIMEIGTLQKPHGVKGEINTALTSDDIDLRELRCIVIDIDGIFVPFFIDSIRPKSHTSVLIHIDGVNSDVQAKELCGKPVYALLSDLRRSGIDLTESDEDGFYLCDLIGFSISTNGNAPEGVVEDFDDSTENLLLIVKTDKGKRIYLPFVEQFIDDIDFPGRTVRMNLPDGLIDLNN